MGELHDAAQHETSTPYDDRKVKFNSLKNRLCRLEVWRELAVRPSISDCDDDDRDLLAAATDDLDVLMLRCSIVRKEMNAYLPIVTGPHDHALVSRLSTIPGAGFGLFYEPLRGETSQSPYPATQPTSFPAGRIICYYYGHIHCYQSAKTLRDRSYLMLVEGDLLVDPGPIPEIKARYVNDPLNPKSVNCVYVPDPAHYRSALVTTRAIEVGEELFASYGDSYWAQHSTPGRVKL